MAQRLAHLFPVLLLLLQLSGCTGMIFYPQKQWVMTPDEKGYDYQNLAIPTEQGMYLNGWLLPQAAVGLQQPKGAVLFFHGNAENISTHINSVHWLVDAGYDVVLVDYRGYGHSDGEVGVDENMADIRLAISWFNQRYHGELPTYLIGQSLGAAMSGFVVATEPVLREPFNAVVLDSGFAGYRRITREVMSRHWLTGWLKYPVSWGMPGKLDLIDCIADISPTPLMIIHGKGDYVVPYQHGSDLFAAAAEPKTFLSFEGLHIAAFNDPENRKTLLKFFEQHQ